MIGLLNAYRFEENAPSYQLEYGTMCVEFLARAFPGVHVSMFEVGLGKTPHSVNQCETWIITGSPKAAYDQDPWIRELGAFVREAHEQKKKMIGICFGHQLLAHYLGGRTERAPNGWGVGVHEFQIVNLKPWMQPELKQVSLLFSHQDQVTKLPSGAELLAQDHSCPHQMYSIGGHIISLQGHPEFTTAFAKHRMDSRIPAIGQAKYERAVATLGQRTHSTELGQWMNCFVNGGS